MRSSSPGVDKRRGDRSASPVSSEDRKIKRRHSGSKSVEEKPHSDYEKDDSGDANSDKDLKEASDTEEIAESAKVKHIQIIEC